MATTPTTLSSSLTHLIIHRTKTLLKVHPNTTQTTLFKTHHPISNSNSISISISISISSMTANAQSETNSNSEPTPPNPIKTVRVVIKGRVQGVFYRNWTVENARGLGLKGWVRNRRDGSVEALFSGEDKVVDEMQQRCRRGPPDALVTGFQVFPCNDDPGEGFDLKPTV